MNKTQLIKQYELALKRTKEVLSKADNDYQRGYCAGKIVEIKKAIIWLKRL